MKKYVHEDEIVIFFNDDMIVVSENYQKGVSVLNRNSPKEGFVLNENPSKEILSAMDSAEEIKEMPEEIWDIIEG